MRTLPGMVETPSARTGPVASGPASSAPGACPAPALRVMIVDDSVVARGLVSRWLSSTEGLEVVATAGSGRTALDLLPDARPDVVLLDLDMPDMDGVTALPLILRQRPDICVVVVSTLSLRNAEISLKCLALGAIDCLPKPTSLRELTLVPEFREELTARISALRERRPSRPAIRPGPAALPPSLTFPRAGATRSRAVLIGASTGGPRALPKVLGGLGRVSARLPILIVQHMPPVFTSVLASQLRAQTGLAVHEARHGEDVRPGRVYLAAGGRHMGLARSGEGIVVRISDDPPVMHCRPALDVLFRDAAAEFGNAVTAVVLTGMGCDGLEGSRLLAEAGAPVIVQDEASAVIWGMPGSIARAGLARAVVPLDAMPGAIEAAALNEDPSGASRRGPA